MSKKTLWAGLLSCSLAWTQPSQPHLTEGDANFYSVDSQTLDIQVAHRTKIEWNEFSIAQGETTRFIQPAPNSVVINQVTGLHSSDILGTLTANGQVYLINPHGIFIGPDALIQTAGFMATTFDQLTLDEGDIPLHFKGDSRAAITHLGQIKTAGGQVTLVAAHIENLGTIEGQNITVVSAPEVWIKSDEKGVYLIPQVSIQQIEASRDPMEFVIKQEGLIRATGCVENQGRIYLVSSQSTNINGRLEAAGGSVDVLGDRILLQEKAFIDVSQIAKAGSIRVGGDYQGANPAIPNASHTT
ncbi:MAG: filamentous hemagglutinin N-terminal domain-containing protein, partial [Rhabdochlamydiaceae bacterium]